MNRLQDLSPLKFENLSDSDEAPPVVISGRFSTAGRKHTCATFTPLHYEANYAYPLLVWLHGPGDDETQLRRIMPLVSLRNYAGVAPRGTVSMERAGANERSGHKPGFTWAQTRAHVALAEQAVFDAIESSCERFSIAPQRVFLAGFDCGGTMAFRLAMNHPTRFAGVLSLGGEFPAERTPLLHLTDARRVPVFLAYGRDSRAYATPTVCDNLKLLHAAGMNVALRQYPCGHELTTQMLSDMDRWMMEQVVGCSS